MRFIKVLVPFIWICVFSYLTALALKDENYLLAISFLGFYIILIDKAMSDLLVEGIKEFKRVKTRV